MLKAHHSKVWRSPKTLFFSISSPGIFHIKSYKTRRGGSAISFAAGHPPADSVSDSAQTLQVSRQQLQYSITPLQRPILTGIKQSRLDSYDLATKILLTAIIRLSRSKSWQLKCQRETPVHIMITRRGVPLKLLKPRIKTLHGSILVGMDMSKVLHLHCQESCKSRLMPSKNYQCRIRPDTPIRTTSRSAGRRISVGNRR